MAAPFQVLARVAGGQGIAQSIIEQYGQRGYQSLSADDINNIIAQRQKLIDSGTPAADATKKAVAQIQGEKTKVQITASTMPEMEGGEVAKAGEEALAKAGGEEVVKATTEGAPETKGVLPAAISPDHVPNTEEAPVPKEKIPTVNVDEQAQSEAAAKTVASKGAGVKGLDKETSQMYRNWVNQAGDSNKAISGRIASKPFGPLRSEGMDAVHSFQAGDRTGQLSSVEKWGQDLLKKEQDAGIPVEKRANYLPQYWANSDAEVKAALQRYAGDNPGKGISLRPGFTKEATFPDYATGEKYGLTPKWNNIPDMINARTRASEKALADRGLFDSMAGKGLVQPSSAVKGEGWKTLDPDKFPRYPLKGSDGAVYHGTVSAPAPLADLINTQLKAPDPILASIAKWNTKLKNVVLSAGVPGTAINLHGFNELAATVPEVVNQPSLFTSALQYLFYPKAGAAFVEDNLDLAKDAAMNGLKLSSEDHAFDPLGETKIQTTPWGKIANVAQKAQDTLYGLFAKHDFEQMIPALKLRMYGDVKSMLVDQGYSAADAGRMAGEKANTTFGGLNLAAMGRDPNWQNFWRSTVFAPDFWESRLRYAGKLGTSIFSSSNPLASTYRKALATIAGAYVGMNLWNKQQTGHYMFENPAGHQMDIHVGTDSQGKDIWLRPFGTSLDFMRLPLDIGKSIGQGNLQPLTVLLRDRVSTMLQPIISGVGNVDAFGNPIFGPSTQTSPMSAQIGKFASTLPVVPQVAGGLGGLLNKNQSTAQSVSTALSLPVRFNAPATSPNDSNLADMIYTQRPKLETIIKNDYASGNEQDALTQMAAYNKNVLAATIQAYKDHGHNVTDENAFTQWLINTTRAKGGLKDVFLKPPTQQTVNTAKAKKGKPVFNKIFPSTITP